MYGLPVRPRYCVPANHGTADCNLFCFCDDGCDYAVKTTNPNKLVPHSEWFCTHLGEMVGLASPPCKLVELQNDVAFGSRWESGHDPDQWWIRATNGQIDAQHIAPTLSRIFAFDLFVGNIDRHAKNYIVGSKIAGHLYYPLIIPKHG